MNKAEPLRSVKAFGHVEEQNNMYRLTMEDRIVTADGFAGLDRVGLFGLFDGHGGSRVSDYIATKLKKKLRHKIRNTCTDIGPSTFRETHDVSGLASALTETVQDIEQKLMHYKWAEGQGSTFCTVVVCNDTLVVVSLGDSRAVMATPKEIVRLTVDHKPTHMSEIRRIHEQGGTVIAGRVLGVLNVSRAIGDTALKPYVSSDPDLFTYKITTGLGKTAYTKQEAYECEFIIIACDGVWDVVLERDAVETVRHTLNQSHSAQAAAQALINKALECETKDNVSAVVIVFRMPE